jgi:hypothetical protein
VRRGDRYHERLGHRRLGHGRRGQDRKRVAGRNAATSRNGGGDRNSGDRGDRRVLAELNAARDDAPGRPAGTGGMVRLVEEAAVVRDASW